MAIMLVGAGNIKETGNIFSTGHIFHS